MGLGHGPYRASEDCLPGHPGRSPMVLEATCRDGKATLKMHLGDRDVTEATFGKSRLPPSPIAVRQEGS